MVKQVSVTFEFNPETEEISNLSCFVDGVEKKKKTTRSVKKEKEIILEDQAIITLEANKLVFNNKAVQEMGLLYEDRIIIKYEQPNKNVKPAPIIGKDVDHGEEGSGNKLTKTNTVSYRGNANKILATYGSEFTIKFNRDGLWELVSLNKKEEDVFTTQSVAENLDVTILTDGDESIEIDEMTFKI